MLFWENRKKNRAYTKPCASVVFLYFHGSKLLLNPTLFSCRNENVTNFIVLQEMFPNTPF